MRILIALPAMIAAVLAFAGCAETGTHMLSSDSGRGAVKFKQAVSTSPPASASLLDILGTFSGFSYANKESVCANSSLLDVEEFPGSEKFKKSDIAHLQKSTVRLRVTHKNLAEDIFSREILKRHPDASNFSLGGFTSFAGKDEGICSGTLIGGNILLTAGHCVSQKHWVQEGYEFPSYERMGTKVFMTSSEFALFLVADFNRQQNLSIVASNDALPFPDRPFYPFTVRELIEPKDEPGEDLDYAILKIRGTPDQIGQFALGAENVRYPKRLGSVGQLAVIQHPSGLYKKVAIGQAKAMTSDRLLHSVSTSGGSSGAGVISDKGKIIAIHVEGECSPENLSATNYALPLWRIQEPLSKALKGRD